MTTFFRIFHDCGNPDFYDLNTSFSALDTWKSVLSVVLLFFTKFIVIDNVKVGGYYNSIEYMPG